MSSIPDSPHGADSGPDDGEAYPDDWGPEPDDWGAYPDDWGAEFLPPIPDAVDLVVEVDAMMAVFAAQRLERVDAMRHDALDAAARLGVALTEVVERGIRLELAAALRVTESAAGDLIAQADALVHRFPAMLDALGAGRTTERHTAIFVRAMAAVEPEFHAVVVPQAVALAEVEAVGAFRRSLTRLIETVRAQTLDARHREALRQRRVHVEQVDEGMAWLSAYLPAVEAHAIHGRLTAMAKAIVADEGESRTLDQVRADVLGDLLIEGETAAVPEAARGIRASVVVTVPALALLSDALPPGAEPASVEGIGPIPHARARELCGGETDWTRVLTHPETGIVLSVGRDRYRPPPELRRLVRWRADRCMAPGCGMPASRCEIDHSIAWQDGGETALWNLCPLCKGHHRVKHHGGWTVRQLDGSGGALEWISPTGRRYVVEPERRVPVFRVSADAVATDAAPF
ncbi:DUF222 domain-containing protein [Microbacterium sp.]|uniref:HNH endonuclease n=1 Tax=Microbacterium sp. TaxID=51671 RepID=UPI0035AE6E6B